MYFNQIAAKVNKFMYLAWHYFPLNIVIFAQIVAKRKGYDVYIKLWLLCLL